MSQMNPLTDLSSLDELFVLDKSDTTDSLQGTLKRMSMNTVLEFLNANNNPLVENPYLTITAMLADQANQTFGRGQYVSDASLDPTVTSGSAYYEYLGTTNGNLTDYRKLSENEAEVFFDITPYNQVKVVSVLETETTSVVDIGVAVRYSSDDITELVFNEQFSKYLQAYLSLIATKDVSIKLYNQTQVITLIANVETITNNTSGTNVYTKLTLEAGALVENIAEGDVLLVDLDFDTKSANQLIQKFTVDAVQDDTAQLTSSGADKIGVEYNDGTGNVSAFLFNQIYSAKLAVIAEYVDLSNLQIQLYNYTTARFYTCKILSFDTVGSYKRANICESMVNDFLVNDVVDFQVVVSNNSGNQIIENLGTLDVTSITTNSYGWYNDFAVSSDTTFVFEETGNVNGAWFKVKLNITNSVITLVGNILLDSNFTFENNVTTLNGTYILWGFYVGNELSITIQKIDVVAQLQEALFLDSSSGQYAYKSSASNVTFGNGTTDSAFSVSLDTEISDNGTFQRIVQVGYNVGAAAVEYWWALQVRDTGKIRFLLYDADANNTDYIETDNPITYDEKVNIIAMYTGVGGKTGLSLKINNVLVDVTQYTFGTYVAMHGNSGNQNLHVGGVGPTGTEKTANGFIKNLAIWNKKLTDLEGDEIWDNGSGAFDITTHSAYDSNCISLFKFEGDLLDEKGVNSLTGVNAPEYDYF